MLNSNHSKSMLIFWGVIVATFAFSMVVVIRAKQVHAPMITQNTDAVFEAPLPYTYVVLPDGVTLSSVQVAETFSLLAPALAIYNERPDVPAYRRSRSLDTYIYQLQATIDSADSLTVAVIALPLSQVSNPLWKVSKIDIDDGGSEYFDAAVNLTTGVVTNIFVHGDA